MSMSMSSEYLIRKAASALLSHRQDLHAEIESLLCNYAYETDGPRPMIALDLGDVEAINETLGEVAEFLLRLADGGAA